MRVLSNQFLMFKVFTSLLATSLFTASVSADINHDFNHILTGKAPLTDESIQDLFDAFEAEDKSLVCLHSNSAERYNIFS
jgi:hypothetical protein